MLTGVKKMVNRGKDFESVVRQCFENVEGTVVIRLHDQTNGFLGSVNPCDFIVYKYPYFFMVECKSVHGNRLPISNITKNQLSELSKSSNIPGVNAGILCWWVDRDVTKWIDIRYIRHEIKDDKKSIPYDVEDSNLIHSIPGKKLRVFFNYDFSDFLNGNKNDIR